IFVKYLTKVYMLNRRLIRIKSFKVLFSAVGSGSDSLTSAEKELIMSCEKTRDLYYFLLNISGSIVRIAQERIDAGRSKFTPSALESNPNKKFVENKFCKFLEEDEDFVKFCNRKGLHWGEHDIFLKKVYNSIIASDYYSEYMNSSENSFEEDCNLFMRIFEEEFEDNEALENILEDLSLYWIDDLAYVLNVIIKNIETAKIKKKLVHPNVFLKDDDREFAQRLLSQSLLKYDEYMKLISENVSNWDSDRLVSTDCTLIVMGIAEAAYFPNIPIKVTINEYVELSKYYSTPNSRIFVNGLLDKIIQKKVAEGEIVKIGRGLFEGNESEKI
ncbi:MAG: transcription antitermination protein NusB, partial [Bacteroidales bacterium]